MYYGNYNRRSSRGAEPRWITARFESTCPETGKTICAGETCLYYPDTRKTYHDSSETARNRRGLEFATANAMPDANW
jgi:hypothetical protein